MVVDMTVDVKGVTEPTRRIEYRDRRVRSIQGDFLPLDRQVDCPESWQAVGPLGRVPIVELFPPFALAACSPGLPS